MQIALSPMDYYFYRRHLYTIQFVFEYSARLDLERFQTALKKTVGQFLAAGSRLKLISTREIVLEPSEVPPVRVQKIPSYNESDIASSFLDPVQNCEGEPLLKFLITEAPERTFLGVSFSHLVGDGASFFTFMRNLSRAYKGLNFDTYPSNQRELLQPVPQIVRRPARERLFHSTGYLLPRAPNPLVTLSEKIFYSDADLVELKNQTRREGVELSSNNLLMASLFLRYYQDIPLVNGKLLLRCPVDYRGGYPGIAKNYFGNAVRDALIFFESDEVTKLNLYDVAVRIRSAIQAVNEESIRTALACLDDLREEAGISIFENIGCPGLLVSNLSKFPIYEIGFPESPLGFHHASLNPRLALILPSFGGVEVRIRRTFCGIENIDITA